MQTLTLHFNKHTNMHTHISKKENNTDNRIETHGYREKNKNKINNYTQIGKH